MLKNPKGKGIRFENEVKKALQLSGYFVVRQAASSFPDLVAINPYDRQAYFYEVKCNKYISSEEREKLQKLKIYGNVHIVFPKKWRKIKYIVVSDLYYRPIYYLSKQGSEFARLPL